MSTSRGEGRRLKGEVALLTTHGNVPGLVFGESSPFQTCYSPCAQLVGSCISLCPTRPHVVRLQLQNVWVWVFKKRKCFVVPQSQMRRFVLKCFPAYIHQYIYIIKISPPPPPPPFQGNPTYQFRRSVPLLLNTFTFLSHGPLPQVSFLFTRCA